jgi:tRNA pseudouridine38-40 synthase
MGAGSLELGQPQGDRFRATIEYDGTGYYGFQVQKDRPTVQGRIEEALGLTSGGFIRVVGAGRTDAGVHALGQVISFRMAWKHSVNDLRRALNARLPADIVIRELAQVEDKFHARFSARSRLYRYTVLNQELRSPLERHRAFQVAGSLNCSRMDEAAQILVGRHDFATFGNPTTGRSTVREVLGASWSQTGSRLYFDIEANGFLRRMVRTIVSALLAVGQGEWAEGTIAGLLSARDRAQAPPPAPACGLCLMQVRY